MSQAPDLAKLDDLLSRWHWWQLHGQDGRGFNRRSLVVGDFVSGAQYDASNGAQDDVIDDSTARAIDAQVEQLPDPHRSAVYALARNLCLGLNVWSSPRMPSERTEREEVVREARWLLALRLVAAGVL